MASKSTPRSKLISLAGWGNTSWQNSTVYRPERLSEIAGAI